MSGKLPVLSGRKVAQVLRKVGFEGLPGRGKGSHIVVFRERTKTLLTIPDRRELRRGLLRALLRQADLSVEDFVELL